MRLCYILLLILQGSIGFAQTQPADNSLTLDQAIVKVLEHNPLLKAADLEAQAAAARIRAVKLSPTYQASLELQNFAGSGKYNSADSLETTLSLAKVLELGDKATLRGELAHNKAMLLQTENDAKRLDLLADTTRQFILVVTAQERLQLAKDSLLLAEETLNVVKRRVKAGRSPTAELRRAKINLARKQLNLHHAKHSLEANRVKLASFWGETELQFDLAHADLFLLKAPESFNVLVSKIERNPDLIRFASQKRISDSRIRLAKSKRLPDIKLQGGLRHFNDSDDTGFVLSINVPLGMPSRADLKTQEKEMLAQRDPYLYQQRRLNLHVLLFDIFQELKHALDTVNTLDQTIIPEAKLALKDYERGYAAGRYSFLELTEAQRALLDARLEAVMAASEFHRHQIEIDRLTGAGLATGVQP